MSYKLSKEYTGVDTNYATNFLSNLGFAAQIPNLLFNWLNVFLQLGYVYKITKCILQHEIFIILNNGLHFVINILIILIMCMMDVYDYKFKIF